MTKITTNTWTSRTGEIRHYLDDWAADLFDLDVDRRKNGGIAAAWLGDEKISNAEAGRILCARVWINADGKATVQGLDSREITAEQVIAAVRAAIADGRIEIA